MTAPRVTDKVVGVAFAAFTSDRFAHPVQAMRSALEAAVPLLAPQPVVVDREALERAIAEALVHHYPARGMQVASGQTCECQYWTGGEASALLGAGMGGRDQLNRHRAALAADAVLALLNGTAK